MKPIILMTTALFLLSAPWPDAKTINDLSAGFLSNTQEHGLLAAQTVVPARDSRLSSALTVEARAEKKSLVN